MNHFYQEVDISYQGSYSYSEYQGTLFVGVSFRDEKGIKVKSTKNFYNSNDRFISTLPSLSVFGTETKMSSGWIPVEGPIKGSFVVKNG